ncbi:contractile injection system protein, VgrG/Pvc8 family [Pelosinus sp. IPA-1]|uniref:contractile injection system protein, VgrG/Pvc8 family n=1 Tax=Pelosinus sp. IPA-1 TaxID=3029569 RepID=UPI0024362244|nr:contractile injection system protein, VgrG/Pvc8 family [Pelosinus sp. IPA-1]GMA98762.1 hypothetical protein PIPA1_15620 [Pelosinus sp. IPA-1]
MNIKQGFPSIPSISSMAGSNTTLGSKMAALGKNDLSNISGFVQSASGLGLMKDENAVPLTNFLKTAADTGALSSGKLTSTAVNDCLISAVNDGVLSQGMADMNKAATLISSAKSLGLNAANIINHLPSILDKAKKQGILPQKDSSTEEKQEEKGGPPPSVGPSITSHKIRFEPYELADILEVQMFQTINQHAKLYIRGVLAPSAEQKDGDQPAKAEDQTIQDTNAGKAAALYSVDEEGNIERLFQGLILNVKQTQTSELKYIEAEIVSPSYVLDIKKNSRSFQQTTASYDDIIQQVTEGQINVKNCEDTKQTGKLIVQYKETDWEFLKRMASHFNTGLVPVANSDEAQLYFGVSIGQEAKEIKVAAYSVQKNLGDYQTVQANDVTHSNPSLDDTDFITYRIDSFDRLAIGDAVSFLNHTLYVREIAAVLEQGIIKYSYTLVSKIGLVQKDLFNEELIGVSLMAQVKVITKDKVQAHIVEIDPEWDGNADWYFPYSTVFSSPDGSGWYCMPEPGDTVHIHFPNHKEEDSVAASSVNSDQSLAGQSRDKDDDEPRSDPDQKSFSNKYGKEVLFTPDGIYITNKAGQIFINLTDADGITIVSEKDITINAKENIYLKADKELLITAGESLTLKGRTSTITMDKENIIKIQGDKVKTN